MRKNLNLLQCAFLYPVICFLLSQPIYAEMRFSEWLQDKQGSSRLASNETALCISPDGKNLYAVGQVENALIVYSRNAATGMISVQTIVKDGENGTEGLLMPTSVVVSRNGKWVYVASTASSSILVFSRQLDGSLQWVRSYSSTLRNYEGLVTPEKIYLAPNGSMLVYTRAAIKPRIIEIDTATGAFKSDYPIGTDGWNQIKISASLSISKAGKHFYSVEQPIKRIKVNFLAQGTFSQEGEVSGGPVPETIHHDYVYVFPSHDEKFLYVSIRMSPAVWIYAKDSTTWNYFYLDTISNGNARPIDLQRASLMLLSENGEQLYVSQSDEAGIVVYARNATTGKLVYQSQVALFLEPGTITPEGIRSMVASPDGKNLYVLPYMSHSLQAFTRDTLSGNLSPLARVAVGNSGIEGLQKPGALAMSPDGRFLYSMPTNRDVVSCFTRNPITGHLTWKSAYPVNTDPNARKTYHENGWPYRRAVSSKDGRHIYEGLPYEQVLSRYDINLSDGSASLGAFEVSQTPLEPMLFTDPYLTGDGSVLFASNLYDGAIHSWTREASTGGLTYVRKYTKEDTGFNGIVKRNGLAGSPDGRFLYLASPSEAAISVFSHDRAGGLEWMQSVKYAPEGALSGQDVVPYMTMSVDGRQLFVALQYTNAFSIFDRDTATGRIRFRQEIAADSKSTQYLLRINGLILSPDGTLVVVNTTRPYGLTLFSRDPNTGNIAYLKSILKGEDGLDGMTEPEAMVMSPDGRHLYVASVEDNSISIFQDDAVVGIDLPRHGGTIAKTTRISRPKIWLSNSYLHITGLALGSFKMVLCDYNGAHQAGFEGHSQGEESGAFFQRPHLSGGIYFAHVKQGSQTWIFPMTGL
jgi:6-phosphogluconolactonase (cycloisomerase 2 family)